MEITGRPKTSVYYHIKDISLSKEKQEKIDEKTTSCLRKYNNEKRGQSQLGRSPKHFNKWTNDRVLLLGHLLFDGEVERHYCRYASSHEVLVNRVINLMQNQVYPYEPKIDKSDKTGVTKVSFYNVELGTYMRKKQQGLLDGVAELSSDNQLKFLTAFFDDEGCVEHREEYNIRRVRGYQDNMDILEIVQKLLSNFDVDATIRENTCNEIVISHRKDLRAFQEKINFSPGVKLNSDRANSVWNESLEKREILARAIDSYQT